MRCVRLFLLAVVLVSGVGHTTEAEPMPPHVTFTLPSKALREARRINVYTPPGYGTAKSLRYPVLYMPDGGEQEDFPHVATTVDTAIRSGEMRPVILVGIENTERRRDMTGPTQVASDKEIAPRVGGSAAFRAFLRDELMPHVRRKYRVTDETAIIGESLAGLFIVETFFLQPGMFGTSIALSPSLWWNDDEWVRRADDRIKARPGLKATLYLASAGDDVAEQAGQLAEVLRAKAPVGLKWKYEPCPDLRHANIYRSLEAKVLREAFAPVPQRAGP
ncbi:alpha/beta hydrolase [Corallococcus aberystwythensis]|uniref:Alpha/beta hydrolase n=1 Tax=Corallococcus aberystwythensis TaxID=2316722 RepID=A0A3A8Q266_9BACT|nr:alpha/beta hydrolase-fold protein [Corallococcus aberystwythensis]RKH62158.1 alpha/beta hydrolase [Corallococcus aberystwythensis]